MSKTKALQTLQKHIKDFQIIDAKTFKFCSKWLASFCRKEISSQGDVKDIWDISVERVLVKIRNKNCYPAIVDLENGIFRLNTFSLQKTNENFAVLYHQTNAQPLIILKHGLKLRYSFGFSKGFPPLIFLSKSANWSCGGEFCYKIVVKQPLYYDTNLNYKRYTGNNYFCVLQNIRAQDIELCDIHSIKNFGV